MPKLAAMYYERYTCKCISYTILGSYMNKYVYYISQQRAL